MIDDILCIMAWFWRGVKNKREQAVNMTMGFWYWLRQPEHIKKKAAGRMRICEACPEKKGPFCGLCGCVLKAKTAAPGESCPQLKWGVMKF